MAKKILSIYCPCSWCFAVLRLYCNYDESGWFTSDINNPKRCTDEEGVV